ncbi:hypothetical protein BPOR_1610g00020 [Botrytis porri]|uniref:Uncharacterized protein n=1 Tax=Botrytis porri TaxID=87229 RepID=A0A4Z1KBG1_9HELO|nr:hypothetical protein BPOR_1610g00020 [Botrytis porri]
MNYRLDSNIKGNSNNNLKDNSLVYKFLCQSFLYWFEVLNLMRSFINNIKTLANLRFILYNRLVIEQTSFLSYCSALIFTPEKSIVQKTFE